MGELGPLGIPQMIAILALMALALWQQGWMRVILSLSLIIWGAFAAGVDMKIGAPLVAISVILFLMGIFRLVGNRRSQQSM